MMFKQALLAALCTAFSLFLAYGVAPGTAQAGVQAADGAFVSPTPADTYAPVNSFAYATGGQPRVVMWYQSWTDPYIANFQTPWMNSVIAHGSQPMITWEPWVSGSRPLAQIANGRYDAYIRRFARASAAWGKPYYLRFAHEMNGNWYPWSPGVRGNTASDYVRAWRRVHAIFAQEGASNVKWVWSPNEKYPGSTPFANVYPGSAYVDLVGIDGYNWGSTRSSGWRTFTAIFGRSYDELTRSVAPGKPIIIAETGSAEAGGDKAAWIRSAYASEIPSRFPLLRGVLWFNENRETDWRVNSSGAALMAYRQVIAAARYQGSLP